MRFLSNATAFWGVALLCFATTVAGFSSSSQTISTRHPSNLSLKQTNHNDDVDLMKPIGKSIPPILLGLGIVSTLVIPSTSHAHNINSFREPSSTITKYNNNQYSLSENSVNIALAPIGELQSDNDTGINPAFSTFGQWFFLLYVVVSLLAGGKEVAGRIK
jgi:hypothetical protein